MLPTKRTDYFIFVGASGTGKTALLHFLRSSGIACVDEVTRKVLEQQLAIDGPALPAKDPLLFVQAMLKESIQDYNASRLANGPVFFDRALPDLVAYAIRFSAPTEVV
jgi:predicted ATPase